MGCRIQLFALLATALGTVLALRAFPAPRDQAYVMLFAATLFFAVYLVTALLLDYREIRRPRRRARHTLHPLHPPAHPPVCALPRRTPVPAREDRWPAT